MRLVAFGTGIRQPRPLPDPLQEQPTAPPTAYAAVSARDEAGRPTRVSLPAPLARTERVNLYVPRDGGGNYLAAFVLADGRLASCDGKGFAESEALDRIRPGTRIVAATDPSGRVLALMASPGR